MTRGLTKDGRNFTIRKPTVDDAENLIRYSKIVFASTDQLLTTPEEYIQSVDQQKIWITESLENPTKIILLAELNNQLVGLLFFAAETKKKNLHTGEFGVSVHPIYQGIGIGRLLIETLIKWTSSNIQIEKIFLQVFATNVNAISLYKRMGFIEEGRHVKAAKQMNGEYIDIIQMYREVK